MSHSDFQCYNDQREIYFKADQLLMYMERHARRKLENWEKAHTVSGTQNIHKRQQTQEDDRKTKLLVKKNIPYSEARAEQNQQISITWYKRREYRTFQRRDIHKIYKMDNKTKAAITESREFAALSVRSLLLCPLLSTGLSRNGGSVKKILK